MDKMITDEELLAASSMASAGLGKATLLRMQTRGIVTAVKVPRKHGGRLRMWPLSCLRPCMFVATLCLDLGMSADAASDAYKAAEWRGNRWSLQIGAVGLTGFIHDANPSSRESAA